MADIQEKELYDQLLAIFATILTTNEYASSKNYETNIGSEISDFNLCPVDDGESDYFTLEDPTIDYDEQDEYSPDHKVTYTYVLKYFKSAGSDTVSLIRAASRDIRRCIGANLTTLLNKYKSPPIIIRPVVLSKAFMKKDKTRGGLVFRFTVSWSQEKWLIGETEY